MKCNHCQSQWTTNDAISASLTKCPFCGKELACEKKQLDTVEAVLTQISQQFGEPILADEGKLMAYFADLAPNLSRQRRILGFFTECGGHKKLLAVKDAPKKEKTICTQLIVQQMKEEMFIEESASRMICDAFLVAICGPEPAALTLQEQRQGTTQTNTAAEEKPKKPKKPKTPKQETPKEKGPTPANVAALVKKYKLQNRYLTTTNSLFQAKLNRAATTYAYTALRETPLLLSDTSLMGSGKEGIVLTQKTLFCNGGFLSGKRGYPVERMASVNAYYDISNRISIQIAPLTQGAAGAFVNVATTPDAREANRIESFWDELLELFK